MSDSSRTSQIAASLSQWPQVLGAAQISQMHSRDPPRPHDTVSLWVSTSLNWRTPRSLVKHYFWVCLGRWLQRRLRRESTNRGPLNMGAPPNWGQKQTEEDHGRRQEGSLAVLLAHLTSVPAAALDMTLPVLEFRAQCQLSGIFQAFSLGQRAASSASLILASWTVRFASLQAAFMGLCRFSDLVSQSSKSLHPCMYVCVHVSILFYCLWFSE